MRSRKRLNAIRNSSTCFKPVSSREHHDKQPVEGRNAQHLAWRDLGLLASVVLAVYLKTLYPSVAGGDSGELVAESCRWGIAHPPGYPLFTVVMSIITQWMGASETSAWRANAFNAACDTGAAVFVYLVVWTWTKQRLAGMTAGYLFAFSPLVWTYAVGAEVFSLNNFFVGALLYILSLYIQTSEHQKKLKIAYFGAFISGLAMCNQHTIVLLELPIIFYVLVSLGRMNKLGFGVFGRLALSFLLGLGPYVYLPITAYLNPQPGSWGDLTTLSGVIRHLRRADYGTFKLFSTNKVSEGLRERLFFYFRDFYQREAPYVGPGLAFVGMLMSIRSAKMRNFGQFLIFALVFYLVVFHSLSNMPLNDGLLYGVHRRFWQQPNVLLFIWVGWGLACIPSGDGVGSKFPVSQGLKALCCLALVGAQMYCWYPLCNQDKSNYIAQYAQALLEPLPANALVLVNYDLQWTSIRYLQKCEGLRPDVTVINLSMMTYAWFGSKHAQYPHLHFPGTHLVPSGRDSEGFSIKSFFDANANNYQIYIGGALNYPDADFFENYKANPIGLLTRYIKQSQTLTLDNWYWTNHRTMARVSSILKVLPPAEVYDEETWEYTIAREYHMRAADRATHLLDLTITGNFSLALLLETLPPMEHSLQNEPAAFQSSSLRKNLGLAYAHIVRSNEALESPDLLKDVVKGKDAKTRAAHRMIECWSAWLKHPSAAKDSSYKTIEQVVESLKGLS